MKRKCDKCGVMYEEDDLTYLRDYDEYACNNCLDNEAEAAWEQHNESLMENGPGPSLAEQQAEARKLK